MTGAGSDQILTNAIVPQVLPAFWGITEFRWDINIRESAILGLLGAGGLGLHLQASICTLATVVLSEWVSAKMRSAIM